MADTQPASTLADKTVVNVYQPAFREFAVATRQWASGTDDLCESVRGSRIYRLQTTFSELIEDYSRIDIFRSGPLQDDNLKNRLFYWPDPRRAGERQLRALLADSDAESLDVDQLAQKSVAVQGFPALERLLFDNQYLPVETAPQCHVVRTVIQNIASMAEQLDRAWQPEAPYVQDFLHPNPSFSEFRTEDEVLRRVVNEIVTGLDILIDLKLQPLLSDDPRTIRSSALWQSQRIVSMLEGNISSIRALLFSSGLLEQLDMEDQLSVEFDYVSHTLGKLKYRYGFADDEGQLEEETATIFTTLAAVLDGIRYTVRTEVLPPLGVGAGFNAEYGD